MNNFAYNRNTLNVLRNKQQKTYMISMLKIENTATEKKLKKTKIKK